MTASLETPRPTTERLSRIRELPRYDDARVARVLAAVVLGITCGALALWCYFDHSIPSWDAAGHLLNGLAYRDLLRHPHPFDPGWIHQLLTVNCFYPPLTYLVSGLVKTVFGTGLWTDDLIKVFWLAVMNIGVFGLVRNLTRDNLAAAFSVLLVNLYPEVAAESHKSMLDFPVMAMSMLALWALAAWKKESDLRHTILLTLATGGALLTKQVCAAFLLLPFAMIFIEKVRNREYRDARTLVMSGATAGLMLVPWLVVSMPTIRKVANEIQIALGNKQVADVFLQNVVAYVEFIPAMMTPFLLVAAFISIVVAGRERHRKFTILSLSVLSAIIILSTLTWQYALPRYFIAALVVPAAYTSVLLTSLWRSQHWLEKSIVALVFVLGATGYLAINFYPHPIKVSPLEMVRNVSLRPATSLSEERFEHPYPDKDWGVHWAMDQITERDGDAPVWLNVLPSTQQLNVHVFEFYAHQGEYHLKPTTSRSWSAAGDSAKFDESAAMHYQWYLLKTGEQGFKFHDDASKRNFDALVDFIRNGGKYELVGKEQLPDGSTLTLHRCK